MGERGDWDSCAVCGSLFSCYIVLCWDVCRPRWAMWCGGYNSRAERWTIILLRTDIYAQGALIRPRLARWKRRYACRQDAWTRPQRVDLVGGCGMLGSSLSAERAAVWRVVWDGCLPLLLWMVVVGLHTVLRPLYQILSSSFWEGQWRRGGCRGVGKGGLVDGFEVRLRWRPGRQAGRQADRQGCRVPWHTSWTHVRCGKGRHLNTCRRLRVWGL